VEDINHSQTGSCLLNGCAKN